VTVGADKKSGFQSVSDERPASGAWHPSVWETTAVLVLVASAMDSWAVERWLARTVKSRLALAKEVSKTI